MNKTRFGKAGRIEDFASVLIRRSHNNKAKIYRLNVELYYIFLSYILNTLMALRAPESHCFLYPSMEGETESANLPMIGMVHLSPGKWPFLYLYTDCSK